MIKKATRLTRKACYCYCCHFTIEFCVWHTKLRSEWKKCCRIKIPRIGAGKVFLGRWGNSSAEWIKNTLQAPQIDMAPWRKAKQKFQLIFKFYIFFSLYSPPDRTDGDIRSKLRASRWVWRRKSQRKKYGKSRRKRRRETRMRRTRRRGNPFSELLTRRGFLINTFSVLIFFLPRARIITKHPQKRYMKAPFDCDKIHQLISEIVEQTFVIIEVEDEQEVTQPYVSVCRYFILGLIRWPCRG